MHRLWPALMGLLIALPASAQDANSRPSRVKVLIACADVTCDQDYFRTEISFVDHVRERHDTDVHILVTAEQSAGGGRAFTLTFHGQGRFQDADDELQYHAEVGASDDDVRRELTRLLTLGLVRYALHSGAASALALTVRGSGAALQPLQDPWNHWTFRTRLTGFSSGERSTTFVSFFGSFAAARTTEDWKMEFAIEGSHRESSFQLPDGQQFVSVTRDYGGDTLLVKSLGHQWSAGVRASLSSSTFLNQRSVLRVAPAVEYDFFPYAESTRRLFTLQYAMGLQMMDYLEETIFGKTSEPIANQSLSLSLTVRQPWGTVASTVQAATFIPRASRNHVTVFGDVELRLVRGLALNASTSITSLRDQVYLPRAGASTEEVLVRQRQFATTYRYSVSFGVSYTFGSIYSPIVNPRLGNPAEAF